MITLTKVSKEFDEKVAVKNLSLNVEKGEVFGFLGPNGAGKTTTMKMILGLLKPTRGEITLFGKKAGSLDARRKIGFLPENSHFYAHLTGREFLEFVGEIFHLSRTERTIRAKKLLKTVGLPIESWSRPIKTYSKGMQQRLGMAQALVNDPEILFLDEPMSGLDPIGRREMKELILSLKKAGKTIFFNSHILSDAEELCDRIAILNLGQILREGIISAVVSKGKSLEDVFVETILKEKSSEKKSTKRKVRKASSKEKPTKSTPKTTVKKSPASATKKPRPKKTPTKKPIASKKK